MWLSNLVPIGTFSDTNVAVHIDVDAGIMCSASTQNASIFHGYVRVAKGPYYLNGPIHNYTRPIERETEEMGVGRERERRSETERDRQGPVSKGRYRSFI